MNLTKAIEILQDSMQYEDYHDLTRLEDAMKLGIEALKRIEEWRKYKNLIPEWQLLGETNE